MIDRKYTIKIKTPSLNEYVNACRSSAQQGGKMKKKVDAEIAEQMWNRTPISEPVFVRFIWHEATRRRDKDNVAFGKKFVLDALQEIGVLTNDNNTYVRGFSDTFVYGGWQGVEVMLETMEGAT